MDNVTPLPTKKETLKPFSMVQKTYLPPRIYMLECIGWESRPQSQGIREKLVFWFKTNDSPYDQVTTGRYFNLYRNKEGIPYFPPRSHYTLEIGRLWPRRDNVEPDDLVGEKVLCKVVEQTKDRRNKKLKEGIKPTVIQEILGWPE